MLFTEGYSSICRDVGYLFMPIFSPQAAKAKAELQKIDKGINDVRDHRQDCITKRASIPTSDPDKEVEADIDAKVAVDDKKLKELEDRKTRIEQEQKQLALDWGKFVLIAVILIVLVASIGGWNVYRSWERAADAKRVEAARIAETQRAEDARIAEAKRVEAARIAEFVKAKNEVVVYLVGIDEQLKTEPDSLITFEVGDKLETLKGLVLTETEIKAQKLPGFAYSAIVSLRGMMDGIAGQGAFCYAGLPLLQARFGGWFSKCCIYELSTACGFVRLPFYIAGWLNL